MSSDVTVAPAPAETSGQPKKSAGSKNAKKDEGKADEKKKSALLKLAKAGVGLLGGDSDAILPPE